MVETLSRLGKYEILEESGCGTFGTAYRARDTWLHRIVALKVLDPMLTRDPLFVQNLQTEAQVTANLEHPHIVRVYDVDEEQGLHFIVMEYIVGGTLAKLLKPQRPLPLQAVCTIVRQTAAALDHIHTQCFVGAQGLVHLDVKPSNIFLQTLPEQGGRVKLSDLGLAQAALVSSVHTQGRVMTGMARYMSPEQAWGETADARSDIYSLGVVAYETLAGRVPFTSENLLRCIRGHAEEPPPPPAWFNQRVSQDVQDVILKALAKDPVQRFPSAGAFARALDAAAQRPFRPAATEIPASPPTPVPPPPPPLIEDTKEKKGSGWATCALVFGAGLVTVLACVALMVAGAWVGIGGQLPLLLMTTPTQAARATTMSPPGQAMPVTLSPTLPGETPVPSPSRPMPTPTASPQSITAPAIALSPASGSSGTRVLVQGYTFTPNDVVMLTWDGNVITPTEPAHVVVNLNGRFQAAFYVPMDSQGGHTISAGTAHETAAAAFTIIGENKPTGTPLSLQGATTPASGTVTPQQRSVIAPHISPQGMSALVAEGKRLSGAFAGDGVRYQGCSVCIVVAGHDKPVIDLRSKAYGFQVPGRR